jgi:hypothetical protein
MVRVLTLYWSPHKGICVPKSDALKIRTSPHKDFVVFLDHNALSCAVGAFAKLRKTTFSFAVSPSVRPSVRPSVHMEQLGSNWTDFYRHSIFAYFSKVCRACSTFVKNMTIITGFAVSPCIFTHCFYWFQQMHYFNSTLVQCLSLKMCKIFKSHTPTCIGHLMAIIRESPAPS